MKIQNQLFSATSFDYKKQHQNTFTSAPKKAPIVHKDNVVSLETVQALKSRNLAFVNPKNHLLLKQCSIANVADLILTIMAFKSPPTKEHMIGTSIYATALAKELFLPKQKVDEIEIAALMHDTGKLAISDAFFSSPTKASKKDIKLYQQHPVEGSAILSKVKLNNNVLNIIKTHHENSNGKGFPLKLEGNEISQATNIVIIADVFDSITKNKYSKSKSRSFEKAISILKEQGESGMRDKFLVNKSIKCVSKNDKALYKKVSNISESI